jgi:hypothetical protein
LDQAKLSRVEWLPTQLCCKPTRVRVRHLPQYNAWDRLSLWSFKKKVTLDDRSWRHLHVVFLLKKTLGLKMVAVAPSPTFRNRMTGREVQNVQLARGVVVVCSSKLLGVAQKRVVLCPFPVLPSAFVKSTRTESFSRLHPKQKVKNERGFVGSWIYVVTSTSYSEELAALTSTISCFEIVRTFLLLFLNGTVTCIADWLKLWEL